MTEVSALRTWKDGAARNSHWPSPSRVLHLEPGLCTSFVSKEMPASWNAPPAPSTPCCCPSSANAASSLGPFPANNHSLSGSGSSGEGEKCVAFHRV